MKVLTATEVSRSLRRLLDSLEHGGEEIVVTRNNRSVARMIPGSPGMNAVEALGDIYGTLDDEEGRAWLKDIGISE